MAKRLGKKQPAHMVYRPRNPTFDLAPARIRRMVNPKASTLSCSAAVYRNLSGFGSGTGENKYCLQKKSFHCILILNFLNVLDISTNQKLQVENIMKKVLGVAFMPEELAGIT